ncbi:hypothetical protein ACNKHX_17735 [Shigella flexneri]
MHDQQVIDAYHPDPPPAASRSRSLRLILKWRPVSPVFLDGRHCFEAIAVRVPTINVTAIDLSVTVKKPLKANEVNLLLQKAAQGAFHGIVDYTEMPLVSVLNHDPHMPSSMAPNPVSGAHLIKTLVSCDNDGALLTHSSTTLAMATVAFR